MELLSCLIDIFYFIIYTKLTIVDQKNDLANINIDNISSSLGHQHTHTHTAAQNLGSVRFYILLERNFIHS